MYISYWSLIQYFISFMYPWHQLTGVEVRAQLHIPTTIPLGKQSPSTCWTEGQVAPIAEKYQFPLPRNRLCFLVIHLPCYPYFHCSFQKIPHEQKHPSVSFMTTLSIVKLCSNVVTELYEEGVIPTLYFLWHRIH